MAKRVESGPSSGQFVTLIIGLCTFAALADAQTTAFTGAKIMPVAEAPVEDGVLVVRDNEIIAVGARGEVRIPADAKRIDVTGSVIIPGLVDTHSHIGDVAGGDASGPIQPAARVLDSVDIRDAGLKRARAGGITTANLMPGSGHLMSGQTLYLKLRDGNTVESLSYKNDDGSPAGGMKMANGTNSMREAPFPGTRAKSAALVRQRFVDALEYRDKIESADGDDEKVP
ncbi:MAG: amidohydrolase family protein, partial [Woeseiaceae bacterium]